MDHGLNHVDFQVTVTDNAHTRAHTAQNHTCRRTYARTPAYIRTHTLRHKSQRRVPAHTNTKSQMRYCCLLVCYLLFIYKTKVQLLTRFIHPFPQGMASPCPQPELVEVVSQKSAGVPSDDDASYVPVRGSTGVVVMDDQTVLSSQARTCDARLLSPG